MNDKLTPPTAFQPTPTHRAGRRLTCTLALALASLTLVPALAQNCPAELSRGHGMLVLGTQGKIYFLHLAMRDDPPHMYQLVFEGRLRASSATAVGDRTFTGPAASLATLDPADVYFLDRNHPDNPTEVYTFQPAEGFCLREIPRGERLTFRGDLIRGHFERDDEPPAILEDVLVEVAQILYFQDLGDLDPSEPNPLAELRLEYLLFGSGSERFLTHRVTLHGQPDQASDNAFHQVFPVTAESAAALGFDLARRAARVKIEALSNRGGFAIELPQAGGTITARLPDLNGGEGLPVTLELGPEHYREVLMTVP